MGKIKILVFGAGAIGTYVGGSLALAGNQVVFVEQPDAAEDLRAHGLRLDMTISQNSVFELRDPSVTFTKSLEEALLQRPFDIAIYALKSFDTQTALDGMKSHADDLPPLLCLSNGVDNEPMIATVLGANKVIAGTVTTSVGRRGVGDIVLERLRGVGLAEGHPFSLFASQALNEAGLNVKLYPNAVDMKWSKMLTNLPANATAAILNISAAEVFAHPGLFQLEMGMLRETLAVMRALRLRVVDLPRVPVRALVMGTRLPAFIARPALLKGVGGGRGSKMPSFHIDLHSGRGKSEVEWLNGAVVRHGEKMGVPTPINKMLTQTLMALTRGEIPLDTYARQPEKLLANIS